MTVPASLLALVLVLVLGQPPLRNPDTSSPTYLSETDFAPPGTSAARKM